MWETLPGLVSWLADVSAEGGPWAALAVLTSLVTGSLMKAAALLWAVWKTGGWACGRVGAAWAWLRSEGPPSEALAPILDAITGTGGKVETRHVGGHKGGHTVTGKVPGHLFRVETCPSGHIHIPHNVFVDGTDVLIGLDTKDRLRLCRAVTAIIDVYEGEQADIKAKREWCEAQAARELLVGTGRETGHHDRAVVVEAKGDPKKPVCQCKSCLPCDCGPTCGCSPCRCAPAVKK